MTNNECVTAIIVVRNAEEYIKNAINSILEQTFGLEKIELILVDGQSTDNTINIIEEVLLKDERVNKLIDVKLLTNEKKILSSGWNMAIRESKCPYVIRIDAHSEINENYILGCFDNFQENNDISCVGGTLNTININKKRDYISMILSSPFGVGNSKFRYSDKKEFVDTVAYGLYKKDEIIKNGYFNEKLKRNQDTFLHSKIRDNGGLFLLDPSITANYYARESILKMSKQAFRNGYWNVKTLLINKKAFVLRHFIPLFYVLSLVFLIPMIFLSKVFLYFLIAQESLYLLSSVYFAFKKTKNIIKVLKMIIGFKILHLSYGIGSLLSFFTKKIKI